MRIFKKKPKTPLKLTLKKGFAPRFCYRDTIAVKKPDVQVSTRFFGGLGDFRQFLAKLCDVINSTEQIK